MKIKNIMLTLVASSTLFAFESQTSNASASTWHNGVPQKFIGKWTSKLTYLKGRNDYETNYVTVSKKTIGHATIGSSNPAYTKKFKYKYEGNDTYSIKGAAYAQGTYWGTTDYYKVHFYNKNKIHIYYKDKDAKGKEFNAFHIAPNLTRTNKERQAKLNN